MGGTRHSSTGSLTLSSIIYIIPVVVKNKLATSEMKKVHDALSMQALSNSTR